MADFDISDLIAAAIEKRPTDFKDMFGQIMVDRAANAVSAIKDNIANNLVVDEEDPQYEDDYEDEYEDEDDEEEDQQEDDEDVSYEEDQDDEETQ